MTEDLTIRKAKAMDALAKNQWSLRCVRKGVWTVTTGWFHAAYSTPLEAVEAAIAYNDNRIVTASEK